MSDRARTRHPDHERIAEEVASWYRQSFPEMGLEVEKRRHGWYRMHGAIPDYVSVTVDDLLPGEVPAFLTDFEAFCDGRTGSMVIVPDSVFDLALDAALRAAGWTNKVVTVFLAYTEDGPIAQRDPRIEIVEVLDAEGVETWARTRLMAFDDSEDEPSRERIDAEVTQRNAESNFTGRWLLATAEDQPVGICGLFEGDVRFVFLLATRVPFRHRGIARALLERVRAPIGAYATVINASEGGRPDALYRSLGFNDIIERHHEYRRP